jgi:hypothetical protein
MLGGLAAHAQAGRGQHLGRSHASLLVCMGWEEGKDLDRNLVSWSKLTMTEIVDLSYLQLMKEAAADGLIQAYQKMPLGSHMFAYGLP